MPTIFLTHIPDMLKNYYGERALAELRKLGDVRLNDTGQVLDAKALGASRSGLRDHNLRPANRRFG